MTAASPPPALPEAYARWQERLARAFFDGHRDQPVVMFVENGELQQLADPGEDGARSLASAVREIVHIEHGTRMFAAANRLEAIWRRGSRTGPPPTLPILALSVLAASEMRSHGSVYRHNYYIPLARALLPDGPAEMVEVVRRYLRERGTFVDVAEMWEQLDAWLKERSGEFGVSTIRGDREQTRIGYPLSQTLVRRSDRAALTRFFATLRLKSDGIPGAESLLRMLQLWVGHRGHGLTERFVESLSDANLLPILGPLLHDLATAWDGKIITAEGLRRLDLRLALDLDDAHAWWVIPVVRDIAGDVLSGTSDNQPFEALITTDQHSTMYHAEGLPPVRASALTSGLTARGESCVAEFQAAKVLVMVSNPDAGGWMSVDAVQPYEEHVFVVSADAAPAVSQALRSAADAGWRTLQPALTGRLFGNGFSAFDRVVFSDKERLDTAIAALPGTVAAGLRLGATVRPRLINGLPIMPSLARNVFLAGGEPDLALPVGSEPRDVQVTLDGQADRLRASLFPFPFCRLGGGFEDGSHTVEADGETLTFRVDRGSLDDREPKNVGTLGWIDGTLQDTPADAAAVCGAVVPGAEIERPALARRGSVATLLLGADGRMTKLSDPPAPTCLPGLSYLHFEVPPGAAVWLAQKRASGWSVTKLRGKEPAFRDLTNEDRQLWAELVANVRSNRPLWQLYSRAWEHYRAR